MRTGKLIAKEAAGINNASLLSLRMLVRDYASDAGEQVKGELFPWLLKNPQILAGKQNEPLPLGKNASAEWSKLASELVF